MSQQTQQSTRTITQIKYPDRFNVVLLNDDFTPMEFVIQLLIEVFNTRGIDSNNAKQLLTEAFLNG